MIKNIEKQQERFFYKVHTSPSAQRVYIGGIDAKHKKGLSEQVTTTKQFSVQYIKKENICDHCKQIIHTEVNYLIQERLKNFGRITTTYQDKMNFLDNNWFLLKRLFMKTKGKVSLDLK